MPYFPTSNCNAANYNPNDIPTVDTYDYSAQVEQKAAYYKAQTQAALQEQKFEHMQAMAGLAGSSGHSNMARSSAGRNVLGNNLQDEAAKVRSQSDQLKNLVANLEYALFEPTPAKDCAGQALEKDNPSTIEGNIQHTSRSLAIAILNLENILAKIGGR